MQPLKLSAETRAATGATGPAYLIRTPAGTSVTLEEAVDVLADADVVFLGEQHDNAAGHAVQLALTEALGRRRGNIILSMEMFERDAQASLDLYLSGALSEEAFKGIARLWPNYDEHYRAAVEFCKEQGFPVLAANVYRPIASRVARDGARAAIGDPWAARTIHAPMDSEYHRRFTEVMGGHGNGVDDAIMNRVYEAQCLKDDTMAESMALALEAAAADPVTGQKPQVIHWNGRFHSDFGLGTVERLKLRDPSLNVAVVSMIERMPTVLEPLTEEELDQGHFVIVAEQP
ncbi:hypothetical protein Poly30_24730 [Planctomycetes bacterium Poly30]|uniref:Haem-binding uptake Tiki superfamily ChaN domain-containing protein n=2 Tax=Saltatorellus ferox TaxID=2528018 RepID=A0A518ESC4_9BACT|nr:hypothetical protein Poly30_24730 [Planctomycetes bacterium Poly30]